MSVVEASQVNPHQIAGVVAARDIEQQELEYVLSRAAQGRIRAVARENVARLLELKKVRATPGQPGWQGSNMGLELEQRRGLATLLCLARARHRGRRHVVILPRTIMLPPGPGRGYGVARVVANQAELDRLCDSEVSLRCPLPPELPPALGGQETAEKP